MSKYSDRLSKMTPDERIAYKARLKQYHANYYQSHRFSLNTYARRYARSHKDQISAYHAAYYQANKPTIAANHKVYRDSHRDQIREQNRLWSWKKRGFQIALAKEFSFYRDVIKKADVNDPIWDELLALPLTDLQRQVVEYARQKMTQAQICKILDVNQSNIARVWLGSKTKGVQYGGIYALLLKAREKDENK